jgi:glutathione synthase/RimK-type ligase-like ATP-grasp enzyme
LEDALVLKLFAAMPKNILIAGDETDPHIAAVCGHLKKSGANVFIINPADGNTGSIRYSYEPFSIIFENKETEIHHSAIDAVWWRMKPNSRRYPQSVNEFETSTFINREWQLALEPLSFFLQHCKWVNKRSADLLLRNKPYQLYLAALHGFNIPKTMISNHAPAIDNFAGSLGSVLYKPLGYFISPPDKILFANIMTPAEVQSNNENITVAPCIFQNYTDKDHELRITIVGDAVFPVKIYSQQSELSKLDWRRDQFEVKYEITELENDFTEKLLRFHKEAGLVYGAYDFIRDKQGDYVFLEVNPAGQWLWLEKLLGIHISRQIADELLKTT